MLSEAMLACAGVINRMGSIAAGSTVSDYHESEQNRQISVSATLMHLEWLGKKFNILDCPGYADFISEGLGALRVGDFALVVVHANHGVGVGTDAVWKYATEYGIPKMIVVNAFDKEETDFDKALAQIREHFGDRVFPADACRSTPARASTRCWTCCATKSSPTPTDKSGKFTEAPATGALAERVKQLHEPAHRVHRRVRRRADGEVLRPGRPVGGGIARRPARGDAEASVRAAVLHVGGKQHRRRAADGFHRQVRLVAGGPAQGRGGRRRRQRSGGRADRSRPGAATSSRR